MFIPTTNIMYVDCNKKQKIVLKKWKREISNWLHDHVYFLLKVS